MLIKEIVTDNQPILVELRYDPNLVKNTEYKGVKFAWDKNVKLFKSAKTGQFIPKTDPVHRALLKQPVNKPARQAAKKPGIGSKISGALGMDGVLAGTRGTQRGIVSKVGSGVGNIVGRAMDNIAGMTARGVKGGIDKLKQRRQQKKLDRETQADLDDYTVTDQKVIPKGEKDPRKEIKDPNVNNKNTKDKRYKNPNFGKTVGKDVYKIDWEKARKEGGNKPLQFKKPLELIGRVNVGNPLYQKRRGNRDMEDVNMTSDDMKNLVKLVQAGTVSKEDANKIIKIANDGNMHLNKAYRIWQNEQ